MALKAHIINLDKIYVASCIKHPRIRPSSIARQRRVSVITFMNSRIQAIKRSKLR